MRWISSVSTAVLFAFSTQAAFALQPLNQYEVGKVSKSVFEIISYGRSGPTQYWCGAGDYARNTLHAPVNQRVYIWRAIGPSVTRQGRKAVQFSLNEPADKSPSPGYSLSVRAVGDSLTAAAAFEYCSDDDSFFRRW